MRDRSKARNYSPEGEEFRREHQRHRAWGLTQRYAQKRRRLQAGTPDSPLPGAPQTTLQAGAPDPSVPDTRDQPAGKIPPASLPERGETPAATLLERAKSPEPPASPDLRPISGKQTDQPAPRGRPVLGGHDLDQVFHGLNGKTGMARPGAGRCRIAYRTTIAASDLRVSGPSVSMEQQVIRPRTRSQLPWSDLAEQQSAPTRKASAGPAASRPPGNHRGGREESAGVRDRGGACGVVPISRAGHRVIREEYQPRPGGKLPRFHGWIERAGEKPRQEVKHLYRKESRRQQRDNQIPRVITSRQDADLSDLRIGPIRPPPTLPARSNTLNRRVPWTARNRPETPFAHPLLRGAGGVEQSVQHCYDSRW